MSDAPEKATTESSGLFGSFLSSETQKKAWGFWENAQKQAQEAWSTSQKQAQEAWNNYDSDALKQRLSELGKTATEYIDEADRRIEVMENGAVTFIQQHGSQLAGKVKEATSEIHTAAEKSFEGAKSEGEVLFSGPERQPLSRLDAELMGLNSAPLKILEATKTADVLGAKEQESLLKDNADLEETYKSLVPAKLTKEEFWGRYGALRDELIKQDERRKKLIGKPGQQTEEDDLDDWGSSGDEH